MSKFLIFRRNSLEFPAKNMQFESVLKKKPNLEKTTKSCKICENLEEFEFEAVQRYVNPVDLKKMLKTDY